MDIRYYKNLELAIAAAEVMISVLRFLGINY